MGSTPSVKESDVPVILFDGVCNLCSGAVKFIIKRDCKELFRFASLQSPFATNLINEVGLKGRVDSIVLFLNGEVFIKSDAALTIARKMNFPWPLLYGFIVIPKGIRNLVYDYIARNRYQWFGKSDQCMVPTPEISKRFVE